MFVSLNNPDDIVAPVGVWWGRRGRGAGYCEQCVMRVEGVVADAHVVHLLTELKPQLLVLSAQVSSLSLQSVSKQQSRVQASHQLLQLWKLLQRETQLSGVSQSVRLLISQSFTAYLFSFFFLNHRSVHL